MCDEILPGDHVNYDVTAYIRMSTPLFPIFDNQRVDTFFFYVPARILWSNWVRMMGEQVNPGDHINYLVPYIESPVGGFLVNDIYDHMAIPTAGQITAGNTIIVNALPFRAYNLIWNQWFRDQNISNSLQVPVNDGPDSSALYGIQRRMKSHDYFTSALPWPQKFTAPNVPVAGVAPVTGLGSVGSGETSGRQAVW